MAWSRVTTPVSPAVRFGSVCPTAETNQPVRRGGSVPPWAERGWLQHLGLSVRAIPAGLPISGREKVVFWDVSLSDTCFSS